MKYKLTYYAQEAQSILDFESKIDLLIFIDQKIDVKHVTKIVIEKEN